MPQTIFTVQNYIEFGLADSVLHLNEDKRGHAGIFIWMRLNVGIPSHIYYLANDTGKICASAKKNTEKQKKTKQTKRVQRKDQEDNYKLRDGSVYGAGAGFENFV